MDLKKLDYDAQRRRVQPNLTIDPGPRVKVTAVEAKVSKRVLKRYVPVFQERAVDNDLLVEGKRNLEDYFQSQGYYDVDVDFACSRPRTICETIEYVISRGLRYKFVRLSIAGNRYFDYGCHSRTHVHAAGRSICATAATAKRSGSRDEENITNLYQSNGFRDVKVSAEVDRDYKGKPRRRCGDRSPSTKARNGWWMTWPSTESLKSNSGDIAPRLVSVEGQPFADVNLANDRDTMLTYYYAHGFPNATFKAAWRPVVRRITSMWFTPSRKATASSFATF